MKKPDIAAWAADGNGRLETGDLRRMTEPGRVVTFIGAGGKTTCMRTLSWALASAGYPVIATTTTKVAPEEGMTGRQGSVPPPVAARLSQTERRNPYFWYAETGEGGKWLGPSRQAVDEAIIGERGGVGFGETNGSGYSGDNCGDNCIDGNYQNQIKSNYGNRVDNSFKDERIDYGIEYKRFWVIEGDGAKRMKLKCWAEYEPQVPLQTECCVLVTDGSLWGKTLQREVVHRPENCLDLIGNIWNAENAWSYFLRSPVFYSEYRRMTWIILFNAPGLGMAEGEKILTDLWQGWGKKELCKEESYKNELFKGELCKEKEIQKHENRPEHLRLAAGDAKEGKLQWLGLW